MLDHDEGRSTKMTDGGNYIREGWVSRFRPYRRRLWVDSRLAVNLYASGAPNALSAVARSLLKLAEGLLCVSPSVRVRQSNFLPTLAMGKYKEGD
jgi:hypothetical protein